MIDGINIKIYSPEKTLVDCFKYRNKIGMDIVLEAIKFYRARKQFDAKKSLNTPKSVESSGRLRLIWKQ